MAGRVIQGFFPGGAPPALLQTRPAPNGPTAMPPRPGASLAPRRAGPPAAAFQAATVPSPGKPLQAHGANASFPVDPNQLGLNRSGGKPLPPAILAKMEAALGADFSAVRIHVGPQAARIGAIAFTTGTDIYFAPGRYQPDTLQGQQLLGHELTHVVQQRQGRVKAPTGAAVAVVQDRALEAEADRMGMRAAAQTFRTSGQRTLQPFLPRYATGSTLPRWTEEQRQGHRHSGSGLHPFNTRSVQRAVLSSYNPNELGFTQATVGASFTSVPTGIDRRLENLRSAAEKIKSEKKGQPPWLTLRAFKLTDPNNVSYQRTFSIDNRRLFVARDAGLSSVVVIAASFEEVYDDLYKFTSQDDGSWAISTSQSIRDQAPRGTLLGDFIDAILTYHGVTTVAALPQRSTIAPLAWAAFRTTIVTQFTFAAP